MNQENLWLTTENPSIIFENTDVGRLKKRLWDASEEEIDKILGEYDVPSQPELGKADSYIQTTVRQRLIENRRKNDIVLVPLGCTENHGRHTVSGLDTFMVTQIAEAVRRFTAKKDKPVALALPPLNYGAHPYHHVGMPGTVILPQELVKELLVNVMLGLWNDGFRKQIYLNNHGQLWVLESAVHEFMYRYQLPAIIRVLDWHRAVREFFSPSGRPDSLDTNFVHADEAETSVALLLFPQGMVDMNLADETQVQGFLPGGHFDSSVDPFRRPHRWSEGEGHSPIEIASTPEGVVGNPRLASARKAKRPVAAILSYLTLVIEQILEAFPPGTVPPAGKLTLRNPAELEPYLKEPQTSGWKSAYGLAKMGW
ncbi:MAG: creatininase family protein [Candidatus Abyssobacteria bacterium SURF_5]|uniref:Creatininase family protein n=1 Tax=Abyssobacteria bacterium (strain SURF_5) TaxID=2093360 RepID=A0A3A4NYX6_ABYX5|nr:MAG: creatininase family protein [Candidatus Abyssubacteria bacterium SURF_5]